MKFIRRQLLDRFEIVAHLDTGGMAEVYLARQLADNALVVIKLLRDKFRDEADILDMFAEESRLMTQLDHPNIVKVLSAGEADGLPYLAMEYLEGDQLGTLSRVARKQAFTLQPSLCARIFLQVTNGLTYVHNAVNAQGEPLGMVHRDISPQNTFVCYDGRIKLLDFGIAITKDRSIITRTGLLKGKIRYMSPEQISAEPLDRRSDIFSLGIVMWEMVTGKRLFKSSSEFKTMKLICEEDIPSPTSARPDLPEELATIIMRCLQRPPDLRYQDAAEIRQALSEYLFHGSDQGRADELLRVVGHLLNRRRDIKQSFIASVFRANDLQGYLFGDLGDGLEPSESAADGIAQPSDEPDPHVQPAPPAEDHPGVERPPSYLPIVVLLALGLLVVAALGIAVWWIVKSDSPDGPNPEMETTANLPPDGSAPAEDAARAASGEEEKSVLAELDAGSQPDGFESADAQAVAGPDIEAEPALVNLIPGEEDKPMGYLQFDSVPSMEVFIRGEYVGRTPIRDMQLVPGVYKLELVNREADINKTFRVRIRKGEVTSHKVIY